MTPEERTNPDTFESIQKAQNCKRCRCGYQRSKPYGQAVRTDAQKMMKTASWHDEAGKKRQVQACLLKW